MRRQATRAPRLVDRLGAAPDEPVHLTAEAREATCITAEGGLAATVAEALEAHASLAGREVRILVDGTSIGRRRASEAAAVLTGTARSVELRQCTEGTTVAGHIEGGGTWDDLIPVAAPLDFIAPVSTQANDCYPPELDDGDAFARAPEVAERSVTTDVRNLSDSLLLGPAIAEPLPALEYVVPEIGMVAGGGAPHLLAGYGYSGKTLAMQSLLLSVAAGHGVWGGYTGRSCRVVHVDLEQGRRLDCRRYQRLAHGMRINLAELEDAIALSVMPRISLTPEHRAAWVTLMTGRDIILIDSLRAATGGLDENSSEIRAPLDMLGSISEETNCRAVVIHHAKKPSEDRPGGRYSIRGSSAIFDACDCVYTFSAEKGEPVNVEHFKARSDGETRDDFALTVSDIAEGDDPKAGLHVQVHGGELIRERREARAKEARDVVAKRDADSIRGVLAAQQGIGSKQLRDLTRLNGQRYAAACLALGRGLEVRHVQDGRVKKLCHFLTPGAAQ